MPSSTTKANPLVSIIDRRLDQENYREQWRWESIVFDLDEWPGLPPFVEVEGASADDVAAGARYLGLSMEAAEYDNVADTYRRYAGRDILSEPRLVF